VERAAPSFRSGFILTLGVVFTLFLALTLAVADSLQVRLPPPPTPIAAEIVAVVTPAPGATAVTPPTPSPTAPPPTRALPTATPTPTASPTARSSPTPPPVEVVRKCTIAPPGWVEYTVRSGDTLSRLAADSGATASAVSAANCLESNRLYAGMVLFLPAEPPPPPPVCTGPPGSWERYTVTRGDTLFSLARSRGISLYGLMTANCLPTARILAGQVIYVPPLPATAVPTDPPPTDPPPPPPPADTPVPPTNTPVPPTSTPVPPTATAPPPPTEPPPTQPPPTEPPPTEPPPTEPLPPTEPPPTEEPPTEEPPPAATAEATATLEPSPEP
jgi:LysM repeat protein